MTAVRPLTLDVTDFGPVAGACVELRPLTVFVGPSNTGKSWLATLVYALHRYFEASSPRWFPSLRTEIETPALPEGLEADLRRLADQLAASFLSAEPPGEGIALTDPVTTAIRLHLESQGEAVGREIERCFGIDAETEVVRKGSVGCPHVRIRHVVDPTSTPAVQELTFSDEMWTLVAAVPDGMRIRSDRYGLLLNTLLRSEGEAEGVQPRRTWEAIGALAHDLLLTYHPAFYLSADRGGLVNGLSTVVSALLQNAALAGIRRASPLAPLSGVQADFLERLVELVAGQERGSRRGREDLRRLGKSIEDEILGGSVKVGGLPGIAYPHFTYHPSGWRVGLPLAQASSMVSELAPVVLYLRHVVASGDLLIIDEPESHLHPAMQVAFIRKIAEIVEAGVRVILTTHSEWVLEELGNVVGRAGLTNRSNAKSDDESLRPRDVGVWLFVPAEDDSGSKVREIELDTDTGLYASGFGAVATALHNDWVDIASHRGDAE